MSELINAANQAVQEFVTYDGALTVALMEYADAKAAGDTSKMNQLAAEIQTNKLRAQQAQLSAQNAIDSARSEPGANGSTFDSVSQANQDQFRTITTVFNQESKYLNKNISQADAIDASPNSSGEAQTNEEKNAADAQGVTNEPGDIPVDKTESVTTKDPMEFQGESGSSPPDTAEGSTPDGAGQEQNNEGGGGDTPSGGNVAKSVSGRISGAPSNKASVATASWSGEKQDMRVMLKVPPGYLSGPNIAPEIKAAGGIVFPYTPNIGYDTSASYGNTNPLHSNYTQYFFKNSAVSAISITGKFTVQNENEANIWLSIVHLGRVLTKMPFGNDTKFLAGSAPPVLRLHGYGAHIFENVPVAITSFKFDLPEGVDYIYNSGSGFTDAMAPAISTFTFSLIPMYSRKEIRNFSVDKWISGELPKGYL
jgi:hypothetical protein